MEFIRFSNRNQWEFYCLEVTLDAEHPKIFIKSEVIAIHRSAVCKFALEGCLKKALFKTQKNSEKLTLNHDFCWAEVKRRIFSQPDFLQLQEVGDFEALHCQPSTNFDRSTIPIAIGMI